MSYDYGYSYDVGSAVGAGLGAMFGFLIFVYIVALAVSIFTIVCNWKVFKKAGKNGWEAIVPIYNFVVLLEITGLPMWYLVLFLVPVGNVVVLFLIYIELAKKFGQSAGFGVGLALLNPIFMAILAFNKNYVYQAAPVSPNYSSNVNYNNANNNVQTYNNQPMMNNQQQTNQFTQQPIQPAFNQEQQTNQYAQQPIEPTINPQPVQNNNCSRCGAPTNTGDKFCMHCGNQL